MCDPIPTVRDILGMPEFSAKVTPIRPEPTPSTTAMRFIPAPDHIDAHDDDIQAAGDELRDQWRPDPKDLA